MAITISKWMGKRDLFANRIQMMERESLLSRILYDRNSCRKIPTLCSSRCLSARHLQVAPAPPYSTLRKQLGDGQQKITSTSTETNPNLQQNLAVLSTEQPGKGLREKTPRFSMN